MAKLTQKQPTIEDLKYYVTVPVSDYTRDGNDLFRAKRIDKLTLHILKVWLDRFIVKSDDRNDTNWFGGTEENDQYHFWFKFKQDADKAENFLRYIKENAIPLHSKNY